MTSVRFWSETKSYGEFIFYGRACICNVSGYEVHHRAVPLRFTIISLHTTQAYRIKLL